MRSPKLAAALALAVACACAALGARGVTERAALASPPAAGPTRVAAVVATYPGASVSSLYLSPVGGASAGAPVATFSHAPGATVRASLLPSGAVVATAETKVARDPSFAASLFLLRPHAPPTELCDGVVFASRPLVLGARVFVARGVAGAPRPDAYRVDALGVDEVDPARGATRRIADSRGFLLFPAAGRGNEIVLYRVGPVGADLVAVDVDSRATRGLGAVLPFARDFSVDEAGGLVFQDRDEKDARRWVVDRVDLRTGARTRLFSGDSMNLAPYALPGGGVAFNPKEQGGLALLGRAGAAAAPLGAGTDAVQARSEDGAWLLASHLAPGQLPSAFAFEVASGKAQAVPVPAGARPALAGLVGSVGGAP